MLLTMMYFMVAAQEASFFEAEHTNFYEIKGCAPNSIVQFYSEHGGGMMLHQDKVNSQGNLLLSGSTEFAPAFVLSKDSRQVRHYYEQEFSFNDVQLTENEGSISIGWDAAVLAGDVHSFEIMKSIDSLNYTVIGTVTANDSSNEYLPYVFLDEDVIAGSLYRIRVVSTQKGTRYTTQPMAVNSAANRGVNNGNNINPKDLQVQIYPTATRDVFTVSINQPNLTTSYRLVNEQGQTLQAGKTDKQLFSLSIASFAAGNYFVVLQTGKIKTTGRVVKL